jgi:hypothetical protein
VGVSAREAYDPISGDAGRDRPFGNRYNGARIGFDEWQSQMAPTMINQSGNPKIFCSAFGCKRWTRKYPDGWSMICGDHRRMVPSKLWRLWLKVKKRADAAYEQGRQDPEARRWYQQSRRIWNKCIDAANRNVGI